MSNSIVCPRCNGDKESIGIGCGSLGCRIMTFPCFLCDGTGVITNERAEWVKRGEVMRARRLKENCSLSVEANKLGISVVELSKMETGRIEPTYKGFEKV